MTETREEILKHVFSGKAWEVDGKRYHCKTVDVLPVIKFGAMTVAAITGTTETGFSFGYRLLGQDYEGFVCLENIKLL